jgi:type IVB pilus formation R64 PilN family outer membrane protein
MIRRRALRLLAPLAVVAGLAACDTPKAARQAIEARDDEASRILEQAEHPAPLRRGGAVTVTDAVWVGGRSIVSHNGMPLPPRLEQPGAIVINSMGVPLDLREIVAEIAAQSGLRVLMDTEAPHGSEETATPSAGTDATGTPIAAIGLPGGTGPAVASSGNRRMTLAWNGTLSGLLTALAAYYDISWEYRDDMIRLFRYEARTFTLAALPSESTIRASVSTSGNNGDTESGSSTSGAMLQNTTNETSITVWKDILESVEAMLPMGAYAAMSPGTGTLSVMAPPAVMRRVAAFIEEQNALITRQVTVSVKVLRLDLTDDYNLGLDLGVVFEQISGQYEVITAGPVPFSSDDAGSWTVRAIDNTVTGKGKWASAEGNTRAVVSALEQVGNVSLVTETSVTTLNGQAAPVSVSRQQSYVASTTTSVGGSGTSGTTQTEVTPGTIITGFNLQVLPRILDDGEVLLQYGLSLSDLREIKDFSTGTTTIQLPDINVRSFLQQAMLRNGDVLVLAGYQAVGDTLNDRSTPGLGKLFGGGIEAQRGKTVLVILLVPRVHYSYGAGTL